MKRIKNELRRIGPWFDDTWRLTWAALLFTVVIVNCIIPQLYSIIALHQVLNIDLGQVATLLGAVAGIAPHQILRSYEKKWSTGCCAPVAPPPPPCQAPPP